MVWTSLFGIVTIVLLARALGFAQVPRLADAEAARQLASQALFDFHADEAVLDAQGRGALVAGADGRVALVRPLGDRWVVRIVNGAAAEISGTRLRVTPAEAMFPPADLDLGPAAARWAARL